MNMRSNGLPVVLLIDAGDTFWRTTSPTWNLGHEPSPVDPRVLRLPRLSDLRDHC